MVRWVVVSILHGVNTLSYFSFQPVLHDWCNKGRGMCYPVCGMMHIKESLLLIGKSSNGFPFSLSEWSFTICPTPYNRKHFLNVLSVSLNKTFPSCKRVDMYLRGRASAHGAMGHRIDLSWWTHSAFSRSCLV